MKNKKESFYYALHLRSKLEEQVGDFLHYFSFKKSSL